MKKIIHNERIFNLNTVWCIIILLYAIFNLAKGTTKIQTVLILVGLGTIYYYGDIKLKKIHQEKGIIDVIICSIIVTIIVYVSVYMNEMGLLEKIGNEDNDSDFFYK